MRRKTHWLIYSLIVLLLFSFCGCGQEASQNGEGDVTVRVELPEKAYETGFTAGEGITALDMLVEMGKIVGFPVVSQGSSFGAYVTGIDNVFQFDQGPESGWIYSINGESPTVGASSYEPVAGDVILWQYITSYDQTK